MRTLSANAKSEAGLKSLIVATTLLERGMPLEQIQTFLGHTKLETTQIYAESPPEMIKASYQKALAG
ncbi:MAG TPA: tyrosine-type recombinase/integrase [Candidatus Tectomicrobia bacterium]|nr:tyrosine-type recombinase/integrase [Candidatus Tectomicrobia bacterium]